jgi:hypothetical protein
MSMTSRGNLRAVLLAAVAIAFYVLCHAPVEAQTVSNTFGGFSKNSDQPIDIESDVLVVHDAQKYATFKGNVKAVQGSTTLRATELDVHYVGGGGDSLTKGPDTTGATPAADTKSEAGSDHHERLGPLRCARPDGDRGRQCGVNAGQECAKG